MLRGDAAQAGFPRLYAAASLKLGLAITLTEERGRFSAALCRGLIEASPWRVSAACPRAAVFRGFMPRPH